ncbi:MAG: tol-pal system protein YbgF [Deltaproteobacteria bacterium]|nr:tol-pal system protein YbgF [Deltaproteobacteria bacterium]
MKNAQATRSSHPVVARGLRAAAASAAALGLVTLGGCVTKAEYTTLLMRVDRIEAEKQAQAKELQDMRTRNADLSADADRLKVELRSVRGQIDEKSRPSSRLNDQLSSDFNEQVMAQLLEVRNRVIELETRLGVKPPDASAAPAPAPAPGELGATSPAQPVPAGAPPLVATSPAPNTRPPVAGMPTTPAGLPPSQQFQTGYNAFQAGRYKESRDAFLAYLAGKPDPDLADDAQYWIGETFYTERQFDYALVAYDKLIKSYPKSDKVPAALLKQGLCFSNLNYTSDARVVFQKLVDSYPSSDEARTAREKLKELGAASRGAR